MISKLDNLMENKFVINLNFNYLRFFILAFIVCNSHNLKIIIMTYKALDGKAPGYITDLLKPYTPTRNLRSSSKNLLNVPPVKLVSYGQRCFSYVAPSLWNSLPDNIRQSSSLQNFKTHIKTHLFNKCYDSD